MSARSGISYVPNLMLAVAATAAGISLIFLVKSLLLFSILASPVVIGSAIGLIVLGVLALAVTIAQAVLSNAKDRSHRVYVSHVVDDGRYKKLNGKIVDSKNGDKVVAIPSVMNVHAGNNDWAMVSMALSIVLKAAVLVTLGLIVGFSFALVSAATIVANPVLFVLAACVMSVAAFAAVFGLVADIASVIQAAGVCKADLPIRKGVQLDTSSIVGDNLLGGADLVCDAPHVRDVMSVKELQGLSAAVADNDTPAEHSAAESSATQAEATSATAPSPVLDSTATTGNVRARIA